MVKERLLQIISLAMPFRNGCCDSTSRSGITRNQEGPDGTGGYQTHTDGMGMEP